MNTIGWKVVKKTGTGLKSASLIGPWTCTYAIKARTVGYKGTPVLAFRTRKAARAFNREGDLKGAVFKAKLDNPRPQKYIAYPWNWESFGSFWQAGPASSTALAPAGTLACDAITLLEPA